MDDLFFIIPSVVIGYSLYNNDRILLESIHRSNSLDYAVSIFNTFGEGAFILSVCGIISAIGDKKEQKVVKASVFSFIETGAIVQIIKHITGRERPKSEPNIWHGPSLNYDSFPSGHVATISSFCAVLANEYEYGFLSYILIPIVAFARVYDNQHWPSDAFLGAIIGILIGNFNAKNINIETKNDVFYVFTKI
jgi:membrane-associated phospholipid phosphatase